MGEIEEEEEVAHAGAGVGNPPFTPGVGGEACGAAERGEDIGALEDEHGDDEVGHDGPGCTEEFAHPAGSVAEGVEEAEEKAQCGGDDGPEENPVGLACGDFESIGEF